MTSGPGVGISQRSDETYHRRNCTAAPMQKFRLNAFSEGKQGFEDSMEEEIFTLNVVRG